MIFKRYFVAALCLVLGACAQDMGVKLNEEQLARMIAREKIFQWVGRGFSGDLTLEKDGSAILTMHGIGEDLGEWEQRGTLVCVKFVRALKREQRCAEVARLHDGTYEARKEGTTLRLGKFYGKGDKGDQ